MTRQQQRMTSGSPTGSADADLITIVEAVYRIDREPEGWLHGILEAAQPLMDRGLGLCAGTYDASTPRLAVEAFVNFANPAGSSERITATSHEFTPEFVEAAFLRRAHGTCRSAPRSMDCIRHDLASVLLDLGAVRDRAAQARKAERRRTSPPLAWHFIC
jgi:hypothetical protein